LLALGAGARAQGIDLGGTREAAHKGHVTLLSDSVNLTPAKSQTVELRFRVEPGFHINSHSPKDELLIPTELKLDNAGGVTVLGEQYPAGTAFRLTVGNGETLDVYQGEFRVTVRLSAAPGARDLTGSLHYQACDSAACFPPKTLAVKVALSGR
jgi:DsbC/DsbD-like thiol-disulfide interchange protein